MGNKKYFLPVIFILCLHSNKGMAQKPVSSLLWKISGNGLEKPSWIFGTFHIMCAADFTVSPVIKEKISSASLFYGELNLDEPGMQNTLAMKMMMTDQTIEQLIGLTDYPAVKAAFQQHTGMSLQMLDHFKPFLAESLLTINMIDCADKIQPETEFAKIAKAHQIPLRGLESIDDQVNTINKEPLDSQIHSFKETVLHFDSSKQVLRSLMAVYQLRNIDSLYQFMHEHGTGGDMEFNLLISRNRHWVPIIDTAIQRQSVFFAVGAGHLGGNEGIIALLRKQGYILTPVNY